MAISQLVWVSFTETNRVTRHYPLVVEVMPDIPNLAELPSILGQDILSRWRTIHNPTRGQLYATVLSADLSLRP